MQRHLPARMKSFALVPSGHGDNQTRLVMTLALGTISTFECRPLRYLSSFIIALPFRRSGHSWQHAGLVGKTTRLSCAADTVPQRNPPSGQGSDLQIGLRGDVTLQSCGDCHYQGLRKGSDPESCATVRGTVTLRAYPYRWVFPPSELSPRILNAINAFLSNDSRSKPWCFQSNLRSLPPCARNAQPYRLWM